jgi:hypothetical protein
LFLGCSSGLVSLSIQIATLCDRMGRVIEGHVSGALVSVSPPAGAPGPAGARAASGCPAGAGLAVNITKVRPATLLVPPVAGERC